MSAWIWRGKRRPRHEPVRRAASLPDGGRSHRSVSLSARFLPGLEIAAARKGISVGRLVDEIVARALDAPSPMRGVRRERVTHETSHHVSISGSLHERLRKRAARDGVSMASIVARVIDLHIP